MPRLGFAYQLDKKTVVRGGVGVFFESLSVDFQGISQTGFSQATSMIPSVDNGLTFQVNLANYPFPNGLLAPTGSSLGLATSLGSSVSFLNPAKHQGYATRWSMNVEHQFGARTIVQVGYIGNRGNHLNINNSIMTTDNNWNSLPVQYLSTSPFRDTTVINRMAANVPNPFYGIPQFGTTSLGVSANTTVSQLLSAFPEFTGVTSTDGAGFSWYHGLGVHAERRFGNNFSAQANYTWSKMMEADSRMNGIQSPLAHSISAYDRPHVLNVNGVFELPFGKGKSLLNGVPGWANHVVGNWSLNILYVAQSGAPMNFGNVAFYGNLQDIVLPRSQRTVYRFFNTGAGFNTNSTTQLATNYRTFPQYLTGARNPGWNDWSLDLLKRFQIRERLHFEVRGQFTNAFNHPNFGGPNLSPTSTTFGQISYSTARIIGIQGQLQW